MVKLEDAVTARFDSHGEKFEITLVFQDEQLRKHFLLDFIYKKFKKAEIN